MRTLILALMLLPAVAVGQVWIDTSMGGRSFVNPIHREWGYMTALELNDSQSIAILLKHWDAYAKECYNDSTVKEFIGEWDSLASVQRGLLIYRLEKRKVHTPKRPIFPGFMEYLRREVKQ